MPYRLTRLKGTRTARAALCPLELAIRRYQSRRPGRARAPASNPKPSIALHRNGTELTGGTRPFRATSEATAHVARVHNENAGSGRSATAHTPRRLSVYPAASSPSVCDIIGAGKAYGASRRFSVQKTCAPQRSCVGQRQAHRRKSAHSPARIRAGVDRRRARRSRGGHGAAAERAWRTRRPSG